MTTVDDIFDYYIYSTLTRFKELPGKYDIEKYRVQYDKHWQYFEKLEKICNTTDIEYKKYIDFVFKHISSSFKIWPKHLCNAKILKTYISIRDINNQYRRIVGYFDNTCKFIAVNCDNFAFTPEDYFKFIIKTNKLAGYIIGGKISKYWLATLGKKNLSKLQNVINDQGLKDTLSRIIDHADSLTSDVSDAFRNIKNIQVHPFKRVQLYMTK